MIITKKELGSKHEILHQYGLILLPHLRAHVIVKRFKVAALRKLQEERAIWNENIRCLTAGYSHLIGLLEVFGHGYQFHFNVVLVCIVELFNLLLDVIQVMPAERPEFQFRLLHSGRRIFCVFRAACLRVGSALLVGLKTEGLKLCLLTLTWLRRTKKTVTIHDPKVTKRML